MRYEFSVDVDRPIDEVWAFQVDFFNAPRLGGQAIVFRQTSPGPVGLGTTYEGRAMILGFETVLKGSFSEWDPPHAATATVAGRPLRRASLRETYAITATGTRIDRTIDLELPMLLRMAWPILRPFVVRRWRVATDNIKTIIESTPVQDGADVENETATLAGLVHRTVMFTDVVGSTALIEVIGDAAWRDLRRWHDTTLRAAFELHHGQELDHAGDGFCVAFGSATEAVACAVDIERTLIDHRRSSGFAPQLRIGLHSGDLQRDGEGLTGAALHVAARVADAAVGGQILATGATLTEAGVTPASPLTAISLRGLAEPVAVAPIAW